MTVTVEVTTPKGFYEAAESTRPDMIEAIREALDILPEEVDGVNRDEWTEIRIRVIR